MCKHMCACKNMHPHTHNFSKCGVLLIWADVHLGPDVFSHFFLHCIEVAQPWNEIQHNGNVTIHEREKVHAIWAAAGMSNDVSYSHTGDV